MRGKLLGAVLLAVAASVLAETPELPTSKLSHPPNGTESGAIPGEGTKAQDFLDTARRMYDQAYAMHERADALRDLNRYEEAEEFEDRAKDYEGQARDYQRRAEELHLPTTIHRSPRVED